MFDRLKMGYRSLGRDFKLKLFPLDSSGVFFEGEDSITVHETKIMQNREY